MIAVGFANPSVAKIEPKLPQIQPILQEVVEVVEEPIQTPPEPILSECSCVLTAKEYGIPLPPGDAEDIPTNSTPIVGGVVLFDYETVGHVAVITKIEADGFWVYEGNYRECEITERFIKWTDKAIRGFAYFE